MNSRSARPAVRAAVPLAVLVLFYVVLHHHPTRDAATPDAPAAQTLESSRALVTSASALLVEHRYQDALAPLKTLFEANPTNHVYARQLADVSRHLGNLRDETTYLEQFFRLAPIPIEACPRLGDVYREQQLLARSIDAFERCLASDPDNPDAIFYLARAYEWSHDYDRAERLYTHGAEIASDYLDMRIGLARLELNRGKIALARTQALTILAESPTNLDAMLVVALAYQREGNRRDAERYYERGVKMNDRYADFHLALGVLAEEQQNDREALAQYLRTLALDATNLDAVARRDRLVARMRTR